MSNENYSTVPKNSSAAEMGAALVPIVPRIFRFSLTLTRSVERAEDLTQSTCLRAIEKRHLFDGVGRLDSWCMSICRSVWLNEQRAKTIRRTESIDHVSEAALQALVPASVRAIGIRMPPAFWMCPSEQSCRGFLRHGKILRGYGAKPARLQSMRRANDDVHRT